jgi:HD-like signal output (HDOD) protein
MSGKARVLFVDDEPRVLDGLRRSLRAKRHEWEMSFAPGGEPALELMASSPYDVVVSDMRMPGMDGAELLTRVSHSHPEVARVVLSGHTEPEAAIKVAIVGHRFLMKPTEPEALTAVIEQLIVRTSDEHATQIRRIAGATRALPTLPRQVADLTTLFGSAEIDPSALVTAVVHDPSLTAKLLQLSNSAFLGARPKNASVEAVVNTLGAPTIHALVTASAAHWSTVALTEATQECLRQVWRHALAAAAVTVVVASPAHRPYAQAAALLQDVGRLAAIGGDGPEATPNDAGVPSREVGVELLHLWGLPAPIVAAVAERDQPVAPSSAGLGVAGALRVAHLLVQQTGAGDAADGAHAEELARLLAHPQMTAQGADWRRLAQEATDRADEWLGT